MIYVQIYGEVFRPIEGLRQKTATSKLSHSPPPESMFELPLATSASAHSDKDGNLSVF